MQLFYFFINFFIRFSIHFDFIFPVSSFSKNTPSKSFGNKQESNYKRTLKSNNNNYTHNV